MLRTPAGAVIDENPAPGCAAVSSPIGVVAVDDHPAILEAIERALGADASMRVIATARTEAQAGEALVALDPDVVVCDVQLGAEAGGLRLLERFGGRDRPRFLMLSAFDYPSLYRAAHDRGAAGYLLKTSELSELAAAVRVVADGGTAFPSAVMRALRSAPRRPSDRELEVLELVAAGASNEEIATRLFLSLKTVESHLRRLFDRYGVMNRTELAVLALREGWIRPGMPG
jgi:DNA-binding NarL/FixJ family response regulator